MTSNNQNPLIQFRDGPANSLPKFSAIQPSHILPAIKDTIKKSTKIRKEILNQNHYNYRDFLLPLFEGDEMLSKIWGVVNHLFSVKNSPELTEVYNKAQPLVNEYFTLAGQDELYKIKIAKMNEKLKKKELDVSLEIEKLIKDEYRDLKNAGAFLSDKKKKDFLQINRKLGELNTQFSNNVLLDTNEYELIVADLAELDGIPEDILNAAKEKATRG